MLRVAAVVAVTLGGGSLVLFAVLPPGSWSVLRLRGPQSVGLSWDAGLSLVFFLQHSVMVRPQFESRLARLVPAPFHRAVYAAVSGLALTAVVILWQPSPVEIYRLRGTARLVALAGSVTAVMVFAWALHAMRAFDFFGLAPLRAAWRGRLVARRALVARGPYRWVRHPLYSAIILIVWSAPDVTADRMLFNLLWTAWIVVGARLEERDLVREHPEYREYQRAVPMLIPGRRPRAAAPDTDSFGGGPGRG
jgi:methanethiol S-methyltransferase